MTEPLLDAATHEVLCQALFAHIGLGPKSDRDLLVEAALHRMAGHEDLAVTLERYVGNTSACE